MDFLELIDEKKIAERQAKREAEWKQEMTPQKIAEIEAARKARDEARERGKIVLQIIREETGPSYKLSFYDESGRCYSLDDLESAGGR